VGLKLSSIRLDQVSTIVLKQKYSSYNLSVQWYHILASGKPKKSKKQGEN
jgi:hypothetical protein